MHKYIFIILFGATFLTAGTEDIYLEESDYYKKNDKYIETESFTEGLDIISLPESHDIYINKRFTGTTPMTIDLDEGSYKLTLMKNAQVILDSWILIKEDYRLIKVIDNRPAKKEVDKTEIAYNSTKQNTTNHDISYRIDSSLYIPENQINNLTLGSTFDLYYKNRVAVHLAAEKELWSETRSSESLKNWSTGVLLNQQPLIQGNPLYLNGYITVKNNNDYFLSVRLSPEIILGFFTMGLFTEFCYNINSGSINMPSGIVTGFTGKYFLIKSETGWNNGISQELQLVLNHESVFSPYVYLDYNEEQTLAGAGFQLGL